MKRWSTLQRELYKIIDEHIKFQIHLSKYRMNSQYGSTDLPRYWITLGDEIIFDYPKQFVDKEGTENLIKNLKGEKLYYPYQTDISNISTKVSNSSPTSIGGGGIASHPLDKCKKIWYTKLVVLERITGCYLSRCACTPIER